MNLALRTYVFLVSLLATGIANAQWTRIEALPRADVPSLIINGNNLYAGTDSAVYVSTDAGTTWTRSTTVPGSPQFIDALAVFEGNIFAGTGGNGVFVSSDNAQTWAPFNQGLVGLGSAYISSFAERNGVLHVGTRGAGVFRLEQNVWHPLGDLSSQLAGNVELLTVKGDTLVAGAGGNGYIWYAPAGASSWSGVLVAPLVVEPMIVTSIAVFNDALYAGSTYGIFRSTDNGAHWSPSSTGVPANRIIKLIPGGDTLHALVTTASTRLLSSRDGSQWTFVEQTPLVYAHAVHSNKLFAARLDGLWHRPFLTTSVEEPDNLPHTLELAQNYPNPFNPMTTIEFKVQRSGLVRLKIVDLLGREVATLIDDVRPTGSYTVLFDAAGLASGVYLYQLTAGDNSLTRRMVVVK